MKKLLVLLLSICLVMASTVGVYANEAGNHAVPQDISDEYQDLEDVNTEELSDDISVLDALGFDENNIIGVIPDNDIGTNEETKQTEKVLGDTIDTENCNTFAYQLTDDIVSEITVIEETEDGGVVLDIAEDDLHNVVFIDDDGNIFLDGNLVEYSEPVEEDEYGTLIPNSYTLYSWSKSAIPPTKSSDYTISQGTMVSNNVELGKKIKNFTSTALALVFGLVLGGTALASISTTVAFSMASEVKSFCEKVAPDTAFLSYKFYVYGTTKSTSSATYTKYLGYVYAQKQLKGASTSVCMYRKATKIAK